MCGFELLNKKFEFDDRGNLSHFYLQGAITERRELGHALAAASATGGTPSVLLASRASSCARFKIVLSSAQNALDA